MWDSGMTFLDQRSTNTAALKKKKAPREQSIASHPVWHDLSTSGVRVTETGGIHKSLNPCNEIPHGQQRWRGEKMWIFSICCGLYCLAERTAPCAETARTCKSLENGFYILPPFFWLHPSPLTNVLGSQGATVLLSGPFPFFTPWSVSSCQGAPLPHRVYYGIECIWPFWGKN